MVVETDRLQSVMPLFKKDEIGWHWSEKYVNFSSHANDASYFVENNDTNKKMWQLARFTSLTTSDLWYLLTVCYRANWQKNLAAEGKLDSWYSEFLAVDIDAFHTKYRSIFDMIASIIKWLSVRPSNVPDSFTDLQKWVQKPVSSGTMQDWQTLDIRLFLWRSTTISLEAIIPDLG